MPTGREDIWSETTRNPMATLKDLQGLMANRGHPAHHRDTGRFWRRTWKGLQKDWVGNSYHKGPMTHAQGQNYHGMACKEHGWMFWSDQVKALT